MNDWGHMVLSYLSACLSVSVVNFHIHHDFLTVGDRDFIFGMHAHLMSHFQMTPRIVTLPYKLLIYANHLSIADKFMRSLVEPQRTPTSRPASQDTEDDWMDGDTDEGSEEEMAGPADGSDVDMRDVTVSEEGKEKQSAINNQDELCKPGVVCDATPTAEPVESEKTFPNSPKDVHINMHEHLKLGDQTASNQEKNESSSRDGCGELSQTQISKTSSEEDELSQTQISKTSSEEDTSYNSIPLHVKYRDVFLKEYLECPPSFRVGFECQVCEYSSKNTYHRNVYAVEHVESVHTNERAKRKEQIRQRTICQFCGKDIVPSKYLKHLRALHPEEAKSVLPNSKEKCKGDEVKKCLYCSKEFDCSVSLDKYNRHINNHMKRRPPRAPKRDPMQCGICGKVLSNKYSYRNHMDAHNNAQPPKYFCDQCPKSFNQYPKYYAHMCFHRFGRRYKCEQCGKGFLHKHHLDNHILSHSDDMPFMCNHCGRQFRMKHHLVAHIKRVHKE